ncbi:iron ABC transporter permease [Geodermatophilus sp. DSM 44513]|uniref:FecCD family ABC transporter permease n=1 Tax=Geodermatophilus sp. DSM 44513 TaxID=1528104 RepID=UPI0028F7086D|nr:iron ABC transporter permease [Geodermatophilus sp. DSM 44513]WNV77637.1 iron ABC transporter permease [Geodermatophilus sp. DSM 44513]
MAVLVARPAAVRPDGGDRRRGLLCRAGSRAGGLVLLLVLLLGVCLLSLRVGSVELSAQTVWRAFTDFDGSNEHLIVTSLRLPRTLIGLGVGAALAVAGAVMQAVTRNPLAGPDILGVNAGAAFAIVTAVFLLGVVSPSMYVWFAFAGAAVTTVLVYGIGSVGRTGPSPVKLALAGVVVTSLLGSWTSGVLVFNERTLDEVRFWLAGSLAGRDLGVFWQVSPFLVGGTVVGLLLTRQLNALALGEDVSRSLGQRTALVRAGCAVLVVLLAGGAVAAAGPIGFVGLAVPHVARALVGPDHRWLVPYAAVLGPVLLIAADVVGRVVARPAELQAGIVTAIVGAPFRIHLARRRKLAGL